MRVRRWLPLIVLGLVLAACGRQDDAPAPTPTLAVFQPPTQDPAVLALQATEVIRLTAESLPTPTPACVDNLRYLEDLTIEDGSAVAPGATLDKRWRVENSGSCNWKAGYTLRLIAGPDLGAPSPQALFPALSGTQAVIRIVFTAPEEPGAYRSAWQAFDPGGAPFGDPIYIDIQVIPGSGGQ